MGDSWVIDLPEGESRRGQEPVGKAGDMGRRVRCGPARPVRYGESDTACTPISSGGTAHSPLPRLGGGAIASVLCGFCSTYPSCDGRCTASAFKGMNGAPTSRSDVQHHRNAGWPTGRESHGHGVLVVVWGGESPLRGEGGQVDSMGKGEGCVMHKNLNLSICRQLES